MFKANGQWQKQTYNEHASSVRNVAAALASLGLERGDRVAIFAENSIHWAQAEWACQLLGLIPVPIYPTLPSDQAQYIVNDSGAKLALVSSDELASRLPGTDCEFLDGPSRLVDRPSSTPISDDALDAISQAIAAEDLATIIYTSGTTGNPKGAMLSHKSFVSTCEAVRQRIPVDENDLFLSFLPLSHVYERMAGHVLPVALGATVAYAGSIATLASDMVDVKPTIMLCVPRFLDSVRSRIVDNVARQSPIKQRLFKACLSQGLTRSKGGFAPFAGILDHLVGAKVRERTGGRLRFFASGGAALPGYVADFYAALRLTVLQGYGLTETCGGNCINHPDRVDNTTVGEPLVPAVEIKIADDGEILIRGDCRMIAYYNLPEETALAIGSDGWFHTGDIGEMVDGKLRITDRKKDLLVLGNGKNVAPQPIENKLRESEWIGEAVLFGDGMEYVCALVIPDKERVAKWAKEASASGGYEEWVNQAEVRQAIKSEIDRINKGIADFEKVKRHEVVAATFSIETGELTPTLKVKRKFVKEKFADVIARMSR
ncbi:MAG: Long-chain-fatty-acid--CoA ligase FadD15 [Fimbriimonadaceae bacterium]|nr:Long-chain-fatty-acid--CoA ligase FadD15 [Fimbriimonadaceae bacterium]